MISGQQAAEWLSRLVQIPSVNPKAAGSRDGVPGEARIAEQIATWFHELGGEVHLDEVHPNRPNVYGIWQGSTDRWLAVDVHTDTVSAEQMTDGPFSGAIRDGRVYGRGAVDTKASLGVILALLEEMQKRKLKPNANLLIGATVDEEIGTTGAPAFAHWIRTQDHPIHQLLVAEPTLCTPIYGHKGVVRMKFDIAGKSAHSSQPHLGENAIVAAMHLVLALQEENERLQKETTETPVGRPLLTVSLIEGGTGINVVPEHCQVSIDRRVVTDETVAEVIEHLEWIAEMVCPLPVTTTIQKDLSAFLQPPETSFVRQLSEWSGQKPAVAPYGTNAWAYPNVAEECVVFGPGSIDQAHTDDEWISIEELEKAAEIYTRWWKVS